MKKSISILAFFFLVLSIQAQPAQQGTNGQQKILVAYFSRVGITNFDNTIDAVSSSSVNTIDGARAGNTEIIAKAIQKIVGGDLHRIETVKKYPTAYRATTDEAKAEQKAHARPALSNNIPNFDSYDVIYFGYPLWWGTLPMPLFTFFESYNFAGKTIIPFCTHGGSGLGSSISDIKKLEPSATVLEGIAISTANITNAENKLTTWLKKIGAVK